MIKPHPESDMSLNVMVLGAEIIQRLKRRGSGFQLIEGLLEDFLKADKRRSPDMFVYSLIFLYSVGIIEYQGYRMKLILNENLQEFSK